MSNIMDDRGIKLLKLLPKYNGCVSKAGREAGYSESYLRKRGNKIMDGARRRLENEIKRKQAMQPKPPKKDHKPLLEEDIIIKDIESTNREQVNQIENDELMRVIGMSKSDFKKEYLSLISQQKDLSTKLKALQGISKYTGIDISTESDQQIKAPVLNILIRKQETNQIQPAQIIEQVEQQTESAQEDQETQKTPTEYSQVDNNLDSLLGTE